MSEDKAQLCFINTNQQPIKSVHVGWLVSTGVESKREYLILSEIVNDFYPHPDAPEAAIIPLFTYHIVKKLYSNDPGYSALFLLKTAQDNVTESHISERRPPV